MQYPRIQSVSVPPPLFILHFSFPCVSPWIQVTRFISLYTEDEAMRSTRDHSRFTLKGTVRTATCITSYTVTFLFLSSGEKYWSISTDPPARSPSKDLRIQDGSISLEPWDWVRSAVRHAYGRETYKVVSHRLWGKSVDFLSSDLRPCLSLRLTGVRIRDDALGLNFV